MILSAKNIKKSYSTGTEIINVLNGIDIKLNDSQFSLIGNDICVKSSFKNNFLY